ncbi:substrate-binding domain-containing protein [Sphingomonas sp. H39-1-10]|uniref:substrate-binding domain-containing protein n=1 Tax=Sphingomonas TaxID=13687 RepID=UPI00087E961D|nr:MULTISPECIES: substrate-binding domain-containing protein [Sphingomonas]MDF0488930.1 substrate-binding domain-containing protein [Sphingomonas pollutisoli]SDA20176.1 transcriptional regulator, LacI family [Sphingomonas sp. NFR15]
MDIRALASHLELSIGTVSRALNDRKDVSPATRQRVLEAAARLGYTPNQSGRTLRSGRTGTIGFMLTLEHDSAVHGEPFFMALWEGVQSALTEHGLDLVILLARKGEDGLTFLRRHVARGTVDAWLLSATQYQDDRIDFLLNQKIPFVALGRSAMAAPFAWIDLDFENVIAEAIALFAAAGHRRIGLVAPPAAINNSHIIVDCYRTALAVAGIPFDPALVHNGDTDENDGESTAHHLMMLADRPSALLLMGETAPVGAYRALRGLGLEPGRDIALIGLRDNPACRALSPDLTCFTLALDELGLALANALVGTLAAHDTKDAALLQMRWPMTLRLGTSHHIQNLP